MTQNVTVASTLIRSRRNITQADLLNKGTGKPRIQAVGKVMEIMDPTAIRSSLLADGTTLAYFGTTVDQP